MRLTILICFLLASLTFFSSLATDSLAGNKRMMEQNANELIMLNSMLLKRLGTIEKDGTIILSGDVIHQDGKVVIKLYKMQQIHSPDGDNILSPEVFDTNLPYQIFLREESLSEIPSSTEGQKK